MNRQLLEQPFEPAKIKQRQGRNGMLDYVEGHSVIQRLNEAFEGAWSFEVLDHKIMEDQDEILVLGKLSAEGVVKMQFGTTQITRNSESKAIISIGDDLKAAATDALKKCATFLGCPQKYNYQYVRAVPWERLLASLAFDRAIHAGPDQTVHVGSIVTLDGSGGSDPDGNVPLTYSWSFASKPSGSTATLSNPNTVNPSFTPDVPGDYVVQLVVTDSLGATSGESALSMRNLTDS